MFNKLKNAYVTLATICAIISVVCSIVLLIKWAYIKIHAHSVKENNLPEDEKIPQEEELDDAPIDQSPDDEIEMLKKNGWDYV